MTDIGSEFHNYDSVGVELYPDEFYHQLKEDLTIDPDKIDIESLKTPTLHHKYLKMLKRAEQRLETVTNEHCRLENGLWLYYEGKAEPDVYKERPQPLVLAKYEVERHIAANEAYQRSMAIVNLWKRRVSFLTEIVKQIDKRSFHIKNAVEYLKFVKGEI